VVSVAIWALTGSSFALLFALLGPVVALAGVIDGRRRSRAEARSERGRFERDVVAAVHAIDSAKTAERDALVSRHPGAVRRLAATAHDPERWRARPDEGIPIRLGTGRIASTVSVAGEDGEPGSEAHLALAALRERAAVLEPAPVVVDARLGIGVCGPSASASSVATAILVQLADVLAPTTVTIELARGRGRGLGWVHRLPHPVDELSAGAAATQVAFRAPDGRTAAVVAIAPDEAGLPRECRVVVRVTGAAAILLHHPHDDHRLLSQEFAPEFVSEHEAEGFARRLREAAGDAISETLPASVALADLPTLSAEGRSSLPACLGLSGRSPIVVDLVADGPHAVVGGTTGSGKSELLVTWVLSMAAAAGPDLVSFLLVDFKGGASFGSVRSLPHTAGVVTDLDEPLARRAILSLRAELRRRERILLDHGARSIDELALEVRLARLVIVVDEFAALASTAPELHELFADLAARGRSLGIHLILCTQRPAGVVRDAVLANCTIGISLRVNNRADSLAVLGAPDAAALPRHPAGRAVLARGDGELDAFQVALAGTGDATAVADACESLPHAHRPWQDPLPLRLAPDELPPARRSRGIPFGLLDIPEEQRREVAVLEPASDGSLLVLGARGSGRSNALAALAHAAMNRSAGSDPAERIVVIPGTVEGAWDAIHGALDRLARREPGPELLLLDDLDLVVERLPPDHGQAFLDALARLAREAPRAGTALVLSATTTARRLHTVAEACDSTLLLRMPDREGHVLAGGSAVDFDAQLPSGRGWWRGHAVQLALVGALPSVAPQPLPVLALVDGGAPVPVVSTHPGALLPVLEALGPVTRLTGSLGRGTELAVEGGTGARFVLGDPEGWQSAWTLFTSLRTRSPVVFHDCSVAEFRSLTRLRTLPPPVEAPGGGMIVLHPDGRAGRVRLAP
jgi:S-DNA-T family DNA segregation ATPase FtsK/SpoIIIE